jgi:F0F1-type ATP synthase delta subunit
LTKITPSQYATALYDQLLETPVKKQDQLIRDFVDTVKQHNQTKEAGDIITSFVDRYNFQQNTSALVIVSFAKLKNLHLLATKLSAALKQNIEIKNLIKPEIIGGFIIYYNDQKLDFSLSSKLQKSTPDNTGNLTKIDPALLQIINIIDESQSLLFSEEIEQPIPDSIEIVQFNSAVSPSINQLEKQLSAKLHKKVIIHFHKDPKIIAGAIIEFDDQKIDATLENKLVKN